MGSQDQDNRIFVVRRPLKNAGKIRVGVVSHSAILARIQGEHYLVEYMNDGKVHTQHINKSDVKGLSIQFGEWKWTKQGKGEKIGEGIKTINQISETMKDLMKNHPYSVIGHNCHIGQQVTRYALGLVDKDQLSYLRNVNALIKEKKQNESQIMKIQRIFNQTYVNGTERILKEIMNNQNKDKLGGVDLKYNFENKRYDGFHMVDGFIWLHSGVKTKNQAELLSDMRIKDMIVPLKIMYDKEIKSKNISVSLDPLIPTKPDGPDYAKIYYPPELQGTEFGQIMIEADHLMKQLKMGVDKQNKPFKYPQSLINVGLSFGQISKYMQDSQGIQRTRQWIIIKDVQILDAGKKMLRVGKITMGLQARIQKIGPEGKLIDSDEKLHKDTQMFCNLFTQHYELLCKQYPIFQKLKWMAKASIIARQMYLSGCRIDQKLVNGLFQFQKTDKSSKIVPKLSAIHYQGQNRKITIEGGCDLTVNQKLSDNIQAAKEKNDEELNTTLQSTSSIDQEQYDPYIIQEGYKKCSQQICKDPVQKNPDNLQEDKCKAHSTKKCHVCGQLLKYGEKYSKLDENTTVHEDCMICSSCCNKIEGKYYFDKQKLLHENCIPRQKVQQCANPKCDDAILQGDQYMSFNQKFYHPDCLPRQKCDKCGNNLEAQYKVVDGKKMHKQCFKCTICQNPIVETQYGLTSSGDPIHIKCFGK